MPRVFVWRAAKVARVLIGCMIQGRDMDELMGWTWDAMRRTIAAAISLTCMLSEQSCFKASRGDIVESHTLDSTLADLVLRGLSLHRFPSHELESVTHGL